MSATRSAHRTAQPDSAPAELGPWLQSWARFWQSLPGASASAFAPPSLVQPILPGWTLNVNSHNSTAPQTEADVVARHSYGRQLGRMADALEALIVERHGDAPTQRDFAEFLSMKREIDRLKDGTALARVEQLARDLALLREAQPDQFARVRAALAALVRDDPS